MRPRSASRAATPSTTGSIERDYTPEPMRYGPNAQAAVDAWTQLLSGPHGRAQAQLLHDLQLERGVVIEGRPIAAVAMPRFVDAAQRQRWAGVTDLVTSAGRRVIAALREDFEGLAGALGDFEPLERELIAAPYGFDWPDVSIRWDAFATGDRLTFLELNGAVPTGVHFSDALATCFTDLPMFGEVARGCTVTRSPMTDTLWAGVVAAWRHWGGRGTPTVGITDWLDGHVHTEPEFWLFRDWLQARGISAVVADPREWEMVDGRLTAQGVSVDVLDRRLATTDILARPDDCAVLIQAFLTNAVCVVDPIEMGLLHRKAFFSLLSDPDHRIGFTAAERRAIDATIPWTRRCTEGSTVLPDGTRGDLVDYVERHRESLVLKPGDDGGGRGVCLGWTREQGEWRTAITAALAGDFVVQERVVEVTDRYPLMDPFGEWDTFFVDTDPMVMAGTFAHAITRLSRTELMNVSQGGSSVPTFVVGDSQ